MLNGIDIASWQAGIVPSETDADFIIVKATGGTGYVNPYWREWADNVLASGKKLGLYHYANERGCSGSWEDEADFFLSTVADYIGRFVPVLDWESDALMNHPSYARQWMQRVKDVTKAEPLFYAYASNVNSTDYSELTAFPLWMASYLDRYSGGGFVDNPVNIWGTGDWDGMKAYQYTSTGRIRGYDGNLDLNCFYGGTGDWDAMCAPEKHEQQPGEPVNNAGLIYQAHVQNFGWCNPVHDGQVAGTEGNGYRLEALRINPPKGWKLRLKLHVENIGWVAYDVTHGNESIFGTVGECRRIEMIGVDVVERPIGDTRKLRFRVHEQNAGWKAWTDEGFASGTDGLARRLEAVQFVIE